MNVTTSLFKKIDPLKYLGLELVLKLNRRKPMKTILIVG
jgi:hypothetical protein